MARLISAKGVTAGGAIGSPMEGMKWVVKYAIVVLHTSSTSGTRDANLYVQRANTGSTGSFGPFLATTDNQTGTGTQYFAIGDVSTFAVSQSGNPAYFSTLLTQYYQYPEVFAVDVITLAVGLVSGDTVDYYILVEEESS